MEGCSAVAQKSNFSFFAYVSELRLMAVWVSNHGYLSEAKFRTVSFPCIQCGTTFN